MKSYLIVEEHNTKTLKIIPYSEYLLNADNVFLYEVISDADTEDEADLIRNHINEVGGIQEYFNEIAREAKKEEKQKAKVHKEMKHLLETNPEFCTTMDKLNELKKKRERYRKEKEELNERRKNAGIEPDFCSTV